MAIAGPLEPPPMLAFNCRLVYYTPAGARRHFHAKTVAPDADAACDIAERLLRKDKRRQVSRVSYHEAIGGMPS